MNHSTTLQAKGQVTLPRQAREEMGVRPGDRLAWVRNQKGHWEIWRLDDLRERVTAHQAEFIEWSKTAKKGYKAKTG